MNEEFQQQHGDLGELPEDIERERGELYPERGTSVPRQGLPHDISYQEDIRNQSSVLGSPKTESKVITTFDARPINAVDFYESGGTMGYGVPNASFTFQVPEGRIGILRKFRYEFSPIYPTIPAADILTSIQVSGITVAGFTNMQLGQYVPEWIDCYALAGEGQYITIFFQFSGTYPYVDVTLNAEFYGNLLISTGRQLEFEPGTEPHYSKVLSQPKQLVVKPATVSQPAKITGSVINPKTGKPAPVRGTYDRWYTFDSAGNIIGSVNGNQARNLLKG